MPDFEVASSVSRATCPLDHAEGSVQNRQLPRAGLPIRLHIVPHAIEIPGRTCCSALRRPNLLPTPQVQNCQNKPPNYRMLYMVSWLPSRHPPTAHKALSIPRLPPRETLGPSPPAQGLVASVSPRTGNRPSVGYAPKPRGVSL